MELLCKPPALRSLGAVGFPIVSDAPVSMTPPRFWRWVSYRACQDKHTNYYRPCMPLIQFGRLPQFQPHRSVHPFHVGEFFHVFIKFYLIVNCQQFTIKSILCQTLFSYYRICRHSWYWKYTLYSRCNCNIWWRTHVLNTIYGIRLSGARYSSPGHSLWWVKLSRIQTIGTGLDKGPLFW